jgi:hypothetical protein
MLPSQRGVDFFMIALIFSQFLAPCVVYCRWSDGEGPQIRGGVFDSI